MPPELVGWRAHYTDGAIDSTESAPDELPDGLLGIVEFLQEPYRRLVSGGDWYWFDGRWRASDTRWGGWVERPTADAIRGIGLDDEQWERASRRMMEDKSWPT